MCTYLSRQDFRANWDDRIDRPGVNSAAFTQVYVYPCYRANQHVQMHPAGDQHIAFTGKENNIRTGTTGQREIANYHDHVGQDIGSTWIRLVAGIHT